MLSAASQASVRATVSSLIWNAGYAMVANSCAGSLSCRAHTAPTVSKNRSAYGAVSRITTWAAITRPPATFPDR